MNAKQITVAAQVNAKPVSTAKPKGKAATVAKVKTVAAPVAATPAVAPAPVAKVAEVIRPITHAIGQSFRPSSGAMLAAHTAVFIKHSGIAHTPVPTALAQTLIGDTAIAYHKREGNLTTVGDTRDAEGKLTRKGGLMLTEKGHVTFGKRQPNPEYMSAYENAVTRGELDDRVNLKNAVALTPIGAGK